MTKEQILEQLSQILVDSTPPREAPAGKKETKAARIKRENANQDDVQWRANCMGLFDRWLSRGDGVAVYVNQAMDSSRLGHRQYVSYGSEASMLPLAPDQTAPPVRLPDIGGAINWAYQLEHAFWPDQANQEGPCALTDVQVTTTLATALDAFSALE